ncbi:MAG: leucine-rich repeat domain-containing protein [Bacteroidales bacterium]|nr:leucine-rich repeat domain-containing protein [Bacteroidales bacterium]MBD5221955.1 leucine-rich repeat domain-containing protein [Bacteroidales bacterium]
MRRHFIRSIAATLFALLASGLTISAAPCFNWNWKDIKLGEVTYKIYNDEILPFRMEIVPADYDLLDELTLPERVTIPLSLVDEVDRALISQEQSVGIIDIIGKEAFKSATFRKITLPTTVVKIDDDAFRWSNIESIEIPQNTKYIGRRAFEDCWYLTDVKILGCREIGFRAFYGVETLKKIEFPENLERLDGLCLVECSNLETIICRATTPPEAHDNDFGMANPLLIVGVDYLFPDPYNKNTKLYVPAESLEDYKNAPGWKLFADRGGIFSIDEYQEVPTPEAVENIMEEDVDMPYTIDGNTLCISCRAGDKVSICDANGFTLLNKTIERPETIRHSGNGILILTVNGKSAKIIL